MRHGMALLLALLAGCVHEVRRGALPDPPAPPKPTADLVLLDVAVVERPLGDDYLESEFWAAGNELAVGLEKLVALEEEGLRVCRLAALPPKLQGLLGSKATSSGPRRMRDEAGKPFILPLGPKRPKLAFRGAEGERTLEDAQCLFSALVRAGEEGTMLRVIPAVKHGAARARPKAEAEPDGTLRWALEPGQAQEEYGHLAVELPLAPGEFLVIGARPDKKGSLGATWFSGDGKERLLVMRAAIQKAEQKEQVPVAPSSQRKSDSKATWGRRLGFSR